MERQTIQRNAIIQILKEAERPLRIDQIIAEARRIVPRLGVATVYRAVKDLLQSDIITVIDFPDAGPCYEITHHFHHHHFRCRKCKKVFDIPGCPVEDKLPTPDGFLVEGHSLVLYGICKLCKD